MTRLPLVIAAAGSALVALGCGADGGSRPRGPNAAASRTAAIVRAERRAYDGAPPVIPHELGGDCRACHAGEGKEIPGMGIAPPAPHAPLDPPSAWSRCTQCHVHRTTASVVVASGFEPLRQDLRRGARQHPWAPPVMPHQPLGRENCRACHTGPAAREEIRCTHPDRGRCTQCHLSVETRGEFARSGG